MASTSSTTSTSASSGALQSLGIGSGLDITSLVENLTTAEMAGPNARIKRQQESVTTQLSAVSTLKSALSTFQSSLTGLLAGSGFSARTVTSSDDTIVKATAGASAALGSYQVEVQQMAQSQQLLSGNFAGGATAYVGTGKLSFATGGKTFSVTIDSTNNTLAGIRDAINSATGNQSVSATLVYGQSGAQLVLSSLATGANAAMTISADGGDGGLSQLTWGTGNTTHFTQKQEAQDAVVFVSGVEKHSASNTVSDAIDGVTLNLQSAEPGTQVSLSIGNDTTQVTTLLKSLVTAYNTLLSSTASLDSYDSTTQEKGPLFGDNMYTGLKRQLRNALTDAVSGLTGNYTTLSSLGITANFDGTLTMDSTKTAAALNGDFKAVNNILSGRNGVISRLNSTITTTLLTGGAVSSRSASLKASQASIDKEQAMIDVRTATIKQRYLAKFNAMDTLLATMQNTSTYLTQQTDALNRASKT